MLIPCIFSNTRPDENGTNLSCIDIAPLQQGNATHLSWTTIWWLQIFQRNDLQKRYKSGNKGAHEKELSFDTNSRK